MEAAIATPKKFFPRLLRDGYYATASANAAARREFFVRLECLLEAVVVADYTTAMKSSCNNSKFGIVFVQFHFYRPFFQISGPPPNLGGTLAA